MMRATTAVSIQECAEESVKEAVKLHDEACDIIIICVPIGKGTTTLQLIQEFIGFTAQD